MTERPDEMQMSQLVDGELTSDEANDVLLNVLDDAAGRTRLKQLLHLRRATAGWRTRQPERAVVILSRPTRRLRVGQGARRLGGIAVAACIGGLLVLAGVWATDLIRGERTPPPVNTVSLYRPAPGAQVTPKQMQQVAEVFALHQAVAGPLAWYAADDQDIRLASARGAEANLTPIAVLLKLDPSGAGATARTLVIVCREQQPAVIELPAESPDQVPLRVYLSPHTVNGKIDMQFAIAMRPGGQQPGDASQGSQGSRGNQGSLASLSGERRIGLTETSLGQLALGERLVNVEASAWPIHQEKK